MLKIRAQSGKCKLKHKIIPNSRLITYFMKITNDGSVFFGKIHLHSMYQVLVGFVVSSNYIT